MVLCRRYDTIRLEGGSRIMWRLKMHVVRFLSRSVGGIVPCLEVRFSRGLWSLVHAALSGEKNRRVDS